MMTLGYVCHAPGPQDRLEDWGATSVRIDFTAELTNEEIRTWLHRVLTHQLSLFATVTHHEATAEALGWQAVRVWQACRELGVPLVGIGLENEPNLKGSGWDYRPREYMQACAQAMDRLRTEQYAGIVCVGAISSLSSDRMNWPVNIRKLFGVGYGGLTYLQEMFAVLEGVKRPAGLGVQVHRYPTGQDPSEPAPGNASRQEEYDRLKAIVGPDTPIVIGEFGATDHDQTPEHAAQSIVYDLNWWHDRHDPMLAAMYAYVWTEAGSTPLHYACMASAPDGTITEKPQGVAILDWATQPQEDA